MKIYISVDLEGISGMVDDSQVESKGRDYDYARKCLLSDLNAAVEGARKGGVDDVVINDSHGTMTNLLLTELPVGTHVIVGRNKCFSMMEGMDSSFGGAFFIGYHARKNTTAGTLSHTYSQRYQGVRINNIEAGEFLINGAFASYCGVPVLLVSGDQALVREAKGLVPQIESAAVKKGLGQRSTVSLTLQESAALIKDAATRAVKRCAEIPVLKMESPFTLEVTMTHEVFADIGCRIPSLERVSPVTLRCREKDYLKLFKTFLTLNAVVESVK